MTHRGTKRPSNPGFRTCAIALVAATALLVGACGGGDDADPVDPGNAADAPDYSRVLAAAPPPLADLYSEGGVVLDGGLEAYRERIEALRGHPVLVNQWASWCGPCRQEFPYLQEQAAKRADEVAFLGIDSQDSPDAAATFLRDHPIPYPSYADPDREIAQSIGATFGLPSTIFYDETGEVVYTHTGPYTSEEQLAADIEKHALSG